MPDSSKNRGRRTVEGACTKAKSLFNRKSLLWNVYTLLENENTFRLPTADPSAYFLAVKG